MITDVISCKQGETINLGKIYFGEEIPVFIRVTDSSGNELHGVEVRHTNEDDILYYSHKAVIDANRIAKFQVPVDIKTVFLVGRTGPNFKNIKQSLPYQPKGLEDANATFIFQLIDEIVRDLFDQNPANLHNKSQGIIPY